MKTISWILWILFAAAAVTGGVIVAKDVPEARALDAARREKRQELEKIRETVTEVGIKYRGFQASMSEIPDSTRMNEAGIIMKKSEEYRKQLYHLERQEREADRLYRKADRKLQEVLSRLRQRALLFGGAAIACLAGALLTRRVSIRS